MSDGVHVQSVKQNRAWFCKFGNIYGQFNFL